MSKRAKDVLGKAIVSAATGEKLGVVADLLLDDTGHQLQGLVVQRGGTFNKTEEVLPVASLQSIGPDVVVSRTNDLVDAREWKAAAIGVERRGDGGGSQPRRDAVEAPPPGDDVADRS